MYKRNRTILIVIFTLMLSLIFTACTSSSDPGQATSTTTRQTTRATTTAATTQSTETTEAMLGNMYLTGLPIVKEKVTYSALIMSGNLQTIDSSELPFFKMMEELTNVKFDFETVSGWDNYTMRINLLLASRDYPDLYYVGMNEKDVYLQAQAGTIIPVNDLIEEFAPNTNDFFQRHPEVQAALTLPDGKMYSFFQYLDSPDRKVIDIMFINKNWLDELGLAMPSTTDEFRNVLTAFKTRDPNKNTEADEVPLSWIDSGWAAQRIGSLYGAFGVVLGDTFTMIKDDKIYYAPAQDGFRDASRYLNELYKDGLIDSDALTQDMAQFRSKGQATPGRIGVFPFYLPQNAVGPENAKEYVTMPPLTGPSGDKIWSGYSLRPSFRYVITNKAKNPEILTRWVDLCYDQAEISVSSGQGIEGVHWEKLDDGTFRMIPQEGLSESQIRDNATSMNGPYIFSDKEGAIRAPLSADKILRYASLEIYEPFMVTADLPLFWYSDDDLETVVTIETELKNYVNNNRAKFIINGVTDAEWTTYMNDLKRLQYEKLISIYQKYYDIYISNLN